MARTPTTSTARSNYSLDASKATLDDANLRRGYEAHRRWHWFQTHDKNAPPMQVTDWKESNMPRAIIECGRMARLHVRPVTEGARHPRRQRDKCIQFPLSVTANSHIGFDPSHPNQRLYLLVEPNARRVIKAQFWDPNVAEVTPLARIAMVAGGRHARGGYPPVAVKPIGPLTGVVYFTTKKGDGRSYYLHKQGEVTGGFPILCVSEDGRLWVAGGSYTAPTPGIAD